ncbi:MAG: gliding motility-associated C-terminal domain-containing protein, partial [Bacteroidales bacterium]|nr:gliding motility-associated C-terminal domain-containing protein [Bacteroidales bacterium]
PALMKANYASVDESQNINLYFQIVNAGQVVEYQLLRSESIDGDYVSIASFTYSGQSQIIYTDENVDASKNIYYYKLAAIDPCGSISKVSNIASNILLTVESDAVTDHSLDWSEYKEWTDGVFAYKIYSFVNGYSAEIGTNGPGSLSMVYDISSYVRRSHDKGFYLSDTFCYYVEAYENSSDASSQNVSRSNLACVNESPICWVPTAFNITSKSEANRVFKPILSFAKEDSYEFAIYNRWGQQVFLTNDITEGWTGRESKQYYHTDYYIYTVKYLDYKDKEYRKTGTFYLLME